MPNDYAPGFYVVPMQPTPLGERAMAIQFVVSYMWVTGKKPGSRALLYNALAIIGVENASGAAIQNHNWGNIMASPYTWGGAAWPHPRPSPGQPSFFRAYPDHDSGAEAWWRLMLRRYRPALERAAADDPVGMVRELYRLGYVVGNQAAYERLAAQLAEGYKRIRLFEGAGWLPADWVGAAAAAAGVVGVAGLVALGVIRG
jgi:hypothetical protein